LGSHDKDHTLIQMYLPSHMTNQSGSPNGKTAPTMFLLHEAK